VCVDSFSSTAFGLLHLLISFLSLLMLSTTFVSKSGFLILWFIPNFLVLKLTVGPSLFDNSANVDCVWDGMESFFWGKFNSNFNFKELSFLFKSFLSFTGILSLVSFLSLNCGLSGLVGMSSILLKIIFPFSSTLLVSGSISSLLPWLVSSFETSVLSCFLFWLILASLASSIDNSLLILFLAPCLEQCSLGLSSFVSSVEWLRFFFLFLLLSFDLWT